MEEHQIHGQLYLEQHQDCRNLACAGNQIHAFICVEQHKEHSELRMVKYQECHDLTDQFRKVYDQRNHQ
jgi:hypothetical protein